MKRITLLDKGKDAETGQVLTTLHLLLAALKSAQSGADFDEQEARGRIIKAVRALPLGAVYLDLEDADHKKACEVMRATKWMVALPEIAEIIRGVLDAKDPPVMAVVAAE